MLLLGRIPTKQEATMGYQRLPPNETGFAICRTPTGRLVNGPVSTGSPTRVDIHVACPPGSRFEGLFHTHPGGVAQPSPMDIAAARQTGAAHQCILSDSEMRCFPTVGRLKR